MSIQFYVKSASVFGSFSVKISEKVLESILRVFKRKLIFYCNLFKQVLTDVKQIKLSGAYKLN